MLVQNKTHHEWVFIKSRSELWNCVQYSGDFLFPLQDRLQGIQDRKAWNKDFLFHGDFILPLSSLIFLLESKLSHQSLRPWQPHLKRRGGGGRSISFLLLSPAMPCSQDTALGHSWLWGRYWSKRYRSQEWQALFYIFSFFSQFFFLFQGKSGVRDQIKKYGMKRAWISGDEGKKGWKNKAHTLSQDFHAHFEENRLLDPAETAILQATGLSGSKAVFLQESHLLCCCCPALECKFSLGETKHSMAELVFCISNLQSGKHHHFCLSTLFWIFSAVSMMNP